MNHRMRERISWRVSNVYAIQFITDDHYEAMAIIGLTHHHPYVQVDCTEVMDYDDFFDVIAGYSFVDIGAAHDQKIAAREHFRQAGGSLILKDFHALDRETAGEIADYLKGLAESLIDETDDFSIAITTNDPTLLFDANGELTGRVSTFDVTEGDN